MALLIPLLVPILIGLAVALWFSTYYAAFDFVKKRRKLIEGEIPRFALTVGQSLENDREDVYKRQGIVMLISFLLLYASIRITCINIRTGAKMELNNLSGCLLYTSRCV